MRIVFVITGLDTGGAEMMLLKLLSRLDRDRFDAVVVSLHSGGDMLRRFRDLSISQYSLGMEGAVPPISSLVRLVALMRRLHPDLIQGWMYHGNIVALCVAPFLRPRVPVLWNVRHSLGKVEQEKRRTVTMIWLGGWLSRFPKWIVNNSLTSAKEHEQRFRYRVDKRLVIPNGFDTDLFKPSVEARIRIRADLALPQSSLLIGLIGRFHPLKDHYGFLRAVAQLRVTHPDVAIVLAGAGVDDTNVALKRWIGDLRLGPAVRLLGKRDDIPQLTAALDIAVCSSQSEAFPNVVGEAMSCGVPCVVTDVGDCAWIVDDTGKVVPPGNTTSLAMGLRELICAGAEERRRLGERARQRIIEKFSLDAVVAAYESLYESVVKQPRDK